MQLEPLELQNMLIAAAEIGGTAALTKAGLQKPYLSKAEAYRIYGRWEVDRWLKERLILIEMDGIKTKGRLDRVKLEAIAKTSNRVSWFRNNRK